MNIAADQFGFALSADTAFAGMGQIEVLTGGSGQNGFTVAGGKGGLCGGLLVFAQGTNRVKNAEISERRGFQRFFVSGKVTPAFSQNRAGMRGFLFEVDGIGNFLKLF